MKIFKCGEIEKGPDTLIVADDIKKAIDLYFKAFDQEPEKVKEISIEMYYVIVQGIIEPEYNNEIPF